MEIILYLCSVIKKEIVKQLKIQDYEDYKNLYRRRGKQ